MKRIAILMSDTGGGHRALANAITTALDIRYPGQVHAISWTCIENTRFTR